jgi:hypothetical protein
MSPLFYYKNKLLQVGDKIANFPSKDFLRPCCCDNCDNFNTSTLFKVAGFKNDHCEGSGYNCFYDGQEWTPIGRTGDSDLSVSGCEQSPPSEAFDCGDVNPVYGPITTNGPTWEGGVKGKPYRRLSCIRWVCRCYDSEGNVTKSVRIGGPTTNNIDIENYLANIRICWSNPDLGGDNPTGDFDNEKEFWKQSFGCPGCIIWVFRFYGWITECCCKDNFEFAPPFYKRFKKHTPADDCIQIYPCTFCKLEAS